MPGVGVSGMYAVVPQGGTVGNYLLKNSSADYDVSWGTPAAVAVGASPNYISGLWYPNTVSFTPAGNFAMTANITYYCPFFLLTPQTFNGLGFVVASAPGSPTTVNLGALSVNTDGSPKTLLASGSVSASAAGSFTTTFATQTFAAGWSFMAIGQTLSGLPVAAADTTSLRAQFPNYGQTATAPSPTATTQPPLMWQTTAAAAGTVTSNPTVTLATTAATIPLLFFKKA